MPVAFSLLSRLQPRWYMHILLYIYMYITYDWHTRAVIVLILINVFECKNRFIAKEALSLLSRVHFVRFAKTLFVCTLNGLKYRLRTLRWATELVMTGDVLYSDLFVYDILRFLNASSFSSTDRLCACNRDGCVCVCVCHSWSDERVTNTCTCVRCVYM